MNGRVALGFPEMRKNTDIPRDFGNDYLRAYEVAKEAGRKAYLLAYRQSLAEGKARIRKMWGAISDQWVFSLTPRTRKRGRPTVGILPHRVGFYREEYKHTQYLLRLAVRKFQEFNKTSDDEDGTQARSQLRKWMRRRRWPIADKLPWNILCQMLKDQGHLKKPWRRKVAKAAAEIVALHLQDSELRKIFVNRLVNNRLMVGFPNTPDTILDCHCLKMRHRRAPTSHTH